MQKKKKTEMGKISIQKKKKKKKKQRKKIWTEELQNWDQSCD